jgi:hypothetical protein
MNEILTRSIYLNAIKRRLKPEEILWYRSLINENSLKFHFIDVLITAEPLSRDCKFLHNLLIACIHTKMEKKFLEKIALLSDSANPPDMIKMLYTLSTVLSISGTDTKRG